MRRSSVALAVAGCLVLASPAVSAADAAVFRGDHSQMLMGGDHIGKIRDEIRLHESRAHELEPMIARDRQSRHDVEVDWAVLERHARDLHARANDFRGYASEVSGRAQNDMNAFANELDASATQDEQNARLQHEIADRLDHAIQGEDATRDWHMKMAQRLRDWLSGNGF
jgi:chromosome segregation ATPase